MITMVLVIEPKATAKKIAEDLLYLLDHSPGGQQADPIYDGTFTEAVIDEILALRPK